MSFDTNGGCTVDNFPFTAIKLYINEVVLGTAFGVLMGPYVANVFDPRAWGGHNNAITIEIMRIVLATGLFAIGVELPKAYMAKHAKGLLFMVVPTMALGWVVVAGMCLHAPSEFRVLKRGYKALIRALFPNLTFVSALAIAACLTPTDPIICAAIVGKWLYVWYIPINYGSIHRRTICHQARASRLARNSQR